MKAIPTVAVLVAAHCPSLALAWEATWESLDSRPNPPWYDESKFGIFVHWGVFSVPSFGSEWFWWSWQGANDTRYDEFVKKTEGPNFAYADYAHRFDAVLYRPDEWADLFARSGAQYVVLTSKHHEGYCNWDSREAVPLSWNWNAMDVGPRRDVLGDLAEAIKKTKSPTTGSNLRWGVYHSLFEWFNPLFLRDKANRYETDEFVRQKTLPELYDLVNKYEPELIWSDGDWVAPPEYWNAVEFLAWYATDSTVKDTAVWNDRWGDGTSCKHGSFLTCRDRYQPGRLVEKKWENALTVDPGSWGYNRNATGAEYLDAKYFVHELIETVAFGGNMLLNVGPAADGTIPAIFWPVLLGVGDWLKVNGDAIYRTTPWKAAQNQSDVGAYYTRKGETLYAIVTEWPRNNRLRLNAPVPTDKTRVHLLGTGNGAEGTNELAWERFEGREKGMEIAVPPLTPDAIPCRHAWTFAVTGIANTAEGDANGNGNVSFLRAE